MRAASGARRGTLSKPGCGYSPFTSFGSVHTSLGRPYRPAEGRTALVHGLRGASRCAAPGRERGRSQEKRNANHGPRRRLGHGRALQLKGRFSGDDGATRYYLLARPSNRQLALSSRDPTEKLIYIWGKQDASYWSGLVAYRSRKLRGGHRLFHEPNPVGLSRRPLDQRRGYNLARATKPPAKRNGPSSNTAATTPRPATAATCSERNGCGNAPSSSHT